MTSVGVAPTSGLGKSSSHAAGVDTLPEEMNDMKIGDDKVSTWKVLKLAFSGNTSV